MAKNVFISFRFSDGEEYKEKLVEIFKDEDVIDYSEDQDRSHMSEDSIRTFLYDKLKRTSITIVILTPKAVDYKKDYLSGKYDDWLYDELRYSLEDRADNRTNAVLALYTKEAEDLLFSHTTHTCDVCNEASNVKSIKNFSNLVKKNMMNIKSAYKNNKCNNVYDSMLDSYCSLIEFDSFINDPDLYLENAISKRDRKHEFELVKRM